ncbi:ABC transporter ATP-binding protein [Mycobacterium sp. NPDC004974]
MSDSVLSVRDAVVQYRRADHTVVRAVNGVSLDLAAGEILGVVGESGCGKSTLARALVGLAPLTSGSITYRGRDVVPLGRRTRPAEQCHVQMIFQDSAASLNPRRTVGDQLAEVIRARKLRGGSGGVELGHLLDRVGLPATAARKYPHEFSGGQRQRIALARALATEPEVIVADEPISALDASAQAYAAQLIVDVCSEEGISLIFISHDLAVVRAIADRVAVMYLGRVAELGATAAVWRAPRHPYARALIDAVPVPDGRRRQLRVLPGDVPDPAQAPSGCPFHPRCPEAVDICATELPPLLEMGEGRTAACHLADAAVLY